MKIVVVGAGVSGLTAGAPAGTVSAVAGVPGLGRCAVGPAL